MAIFSLGAHGHCSRISVGLFLMGWYVYSASSFGLLLLGWRSLNLVSADSPCDYSSQICGSLPIPYPFGMSGECGLPDYRISCKPDPSSGEGELPFLQVGTASTAELQVLQFSTNTITVNSTQLKAMPSYPQCSGDGVASLDLSSSGPFVLSDNNWFAVIGCRSGGTCVASSPNSPDPDFRDGYTIQCDTGCYNEYLFPFCNTYSCCVNAIPPGSRKLNLTGSGISYRDFKDVCGFSTVLSPSTYDAQNMVGIFGAGQYGLVISWALITSENCSTVKSRTDYACSDNAGCLDDSRVPGYTCNCSEGYRGDGYKNGTDCKDIDECKEGLDDCERPPLGMCINTPGSFKCNCTDGSTGTGSRGNCTVAHDKKTNVPLMITLGGIAGGIVGALIVIVFIFIVCAWRRVSRRKKQREENFHRNGGQELRSMLFSEEQLCRATSNFSREHELGKGGYGTVYWGDLVNHGKVAIKKAKHMDDAEREEEQMKCFVSEILLLGKTTHENIVRLLGCCVETRVPLLVYEFVENGTLWDHLHPDRGAQRSLLGSSWARRLSIAVDTAKAVNYLHKMSPPILHRDIKSANILIDKSHNAKVADFGASRFLTSGATHLTFAVVVGTHGYLDPEYNLSFKFTDKSDVYSFGVILLELITSMPADLGTKLGILAHHFRTSFRTGNHTNLIDPKLSTDAKVVASIQDVAELAIDCLAMEGHQRPSMEQVLSKLKGIQSKRMQLDEVVGIYTQGSSALAEHYMRTIEAQQSPGNSEEHSTASLLAPSHRSTTISSSSTTTAEIGLTCFSSEYSQENLQWML